MVDNVTVLCMSVDTKFEWENYIVKSEIRIFLGLGRKGHTTIFLKVS